MTTLQDKTPEELTRMLAELLGWKPDTRGLGWLAPDGCYVDLPPYATSYDAILGEIHKLTDGQIKKLGSVILNLMRPPHIRIPEAWTADQHELIGDVIHRISPADLTRALIMTLQSK